MRNKALTLTICFIFVAFAALTLLYLKSELSNHTADGQPVSLENQVEIKKEGKENYILAPVPTLPLQGSSLESFIPENWVLEEFVELDYNRDGIPDYVGILVFGEELQQSFRALDRDSSDIFFYSLDGKLLNVIPAIDIDTPTPAAVYKPFEPGLQY